MRDALLEAAWSAEASSKEMERNMIQNDINEGRERAAKIRKLL